MAVRILLADHHLLVRQGLRLLLEQQHFEVVGEAADDLGAVALGAGAGPDVALVDAGLPRWGGLDAARRLRDACPDVRTILLGTIDERYVVEALRSSVCGFLLKTQAIEDLIQAVRNVHQGGIYLAPQPASAFLRRVSPHAALGHQSLSPREHQLLQLVADGKTTKQAGAVLGITFKTAEYYRTRLMRKLNVHTTAGLVRYALQANFAGNPG